MSLNFQKITIFLTKLRSQRNVALSLISPLEMTFFHTKTDDARCASRSAQRRRSFPSPSTASHPTCPSFLHHHQEEFSLRHQPSGSPSCLPLPFPSRQADFTRDPSSRTTRDPDNGTRRNFACTPTRSPDSTLPKHGAPSSSTREIDRLQSTVESLKQQVRVALRITLRIRLRLRV